tara:strand:+ start:543 stop:794 length:252 start_codon:yes stop_codon:yes gene_type:complete
MSNLPTDFELFKAMTPEEQDQHLGMLRDVAALGPKPTREGLLLALLPHLERLFGDDYDEYKEEHDATCDAASGRTQKIRGDCE